MLLGHNRRDGERWGQFYWKSLGGQRESTDMGSAWAPKITPGRDKGDLSRWDWLA